MIEAICMEETGVENGGVEHGALFVMTTVIYVPS